MVVYMVYRVRKLDKKNVGIQFIFFIVRFKFRYVGQYYLDEKWIFYFGLNIYSFFYSNFKYC